MDFIPIPNYENLYKINKKGHIYSCYKKCLKSLSITNGYYTTQLYKNNKPNNFMIHRLMGYCFLNLSENSNLFVNHKDGNKLNNNLENLELTTPSENSIHAYKTNLKQPSKQINIIEDVDLSNYKIIINFPNYMINEYGKIYIIKRKRHKKLDKNNNGYIRVELANNGKNKKYYIHRLVAEYYLENPNNLKFVNHKNGNKQNNHYTNLEWISQKNNIKHSYEKLNNKHKYKGVIQYDLQMNEIARYKSQKYAKIITGICDTGINKCCKGIRNSSGGFKWKYIDT